jgi:hypothetical protein
LFPSKGYHREYSSNQMKNVLIFEYHSVPKISYTYSEPIVTKVFNCNNVLQDFQYYAECTVIIERLISLILIYIKTSQSYLIYKKYLWILSFCPLSAIILDCNAHHGHVKPVGNEKKDEIDKLSFLKLLFPSKGYHREYSSNQGGHLVKHHGV